MAGLFRRRKATADWRQKAAARNNAYLAGGNINLNTGTPGEPVVPGMLPRDPPKFTGREAELKRLISLAEGRGASVAVISGAGAIGKTALALHAAHQLLGTFPGGHLYADMRGCAEGRPAAEPDEVLETFLRNLGVAPAQIPAGLDDRAGMLRSYLARQPTLMLLDDAASAAQVKPLLPGAGRSLVLVTSRSFLAGLQADERISLGPLSDPEATKLLAQLIGERAVAEPQAVKRLAEQCGGLPLALEITAHLLDPRPRRPVSRLETQLASERDKITALKAGDLELRPTLEVSYQQLSDGDARTFRLLGLHPGPDFDAESTAALASMSTEEADAALARLAEKGLVTEDDQGRFRMQNLLREFTRGKCEDIDDQPTRDDAEERLVRHYASLADFLNTCIHPRQRLEAEQPHPEFLSTRKALAIFAAERTGLMAAASLAEQRELDQLMWELSERAEYTLRLLRYLDDLVTLHKAALDAAGRAGNETAKARALHNLGVAYGELREFEEAVSCFAQSLIISQQADDRLSTGKTINNLGFAYQKLRRYEDAIDRFNESLDILRELGERYEEGQVLSNLGNTFLEQRRPDEALDVYEVALKVRQETGDWHGEGQTLDDIGNAFRALRQPKKAIDHFKRALDIRREAGYHYGEGLTLTHLGHVYYLDLWKTKLAATYFASAAAAMRDAKKYEEATRLEQLAAEASSRHWWSRQRWSRARYAQPGGGSGPGAGMAVGARDGGFVLSNWPHRP